jgi:hypothetical protein
MTTLGVLALAAAGIVSLYAVSPAAAACPVCVIGAGAGVAIAREFGVSDGIIGVWLGGFAAVTGLWIHRILKETLWFPLRGTALMILSTLLILASLAWKEWFACGWSGIVCDILSQGAWTGTVTVWCVNVFNNYCKTTKKWAIPFRSVLFFLVGLLVASVVFRAVMYRLL